MLVQRRPYLLYSFDQITPEGLWIGLHSDCQFHQPKAFCYLFNQIHRSNTHWLGSFHQSFVKCLALGFVARINTLCHVTQRHVLSLRSRKTYCKDLPAG